MLFQRGAAVITPGGDAAELVERWVEHTADAVSPPWCGEGFYLQSPLSGQTLGVACIDSFLCTA